MIIYVFDKSLKVIGLIEDYYSLTWAERHYVCGDFELELPITYDGSPLVEFGNFLYISSSDVLMIIEDIKPETSKEKTTLVIKGESAESLLKRRGLPSRANLIGNAEGLIYFLMRDNITEPSNLNRKITLFKTTFPSISTTGTFEEQFDAVTIYDVVTAICKNSGYGFKVVKEGNRLAFSVYEGLDRSYSQATNQLVVFSENFDNVISSSFYLSEKGKVNLVIVFIDDWYQHTTFVWEDGLPEPSELNRFEDFLTTNIDRELDEENPLTDSEMLAIIQTRGRAILKEKKTVGVFEGYFDIQGNFKYGIDFLMGDIVQCEIEGRNIKARIIELVRSYSNEGEKTYIAMDFITT